VTPILGSVRGVSLSQARRQEALDRLSEEVIGRPAELLLDLRARVHDPTAIVDGNDRIGAGIENWRGAEPERCADPGSSCPRRVHISSDSIVRLSRSADPGVLIQVLIQVSLVRGKTDLVRMIAARRSGSVPPSGGN